jgi:catechol 2,3-dioxygenase-like lactoylglutathione lyase family enzyme
MPYRFVLEVPEEVHRDAKIAVENTPDAEILIERLERRPRVLSRNDSIVELTVVCHSLNVVDALYNWAGNHGLLTDVHLTAFKGPRVTLSDYDARSLRHLVQGDQYWFENTVARINHPIDTIMEGGARVADVPYGGRLADDTAIMPAETTLDLGEIDNIAIQVRDIARAEQFYHEFFGMSVSYRALQEDGHWRHLGADYDYEQGIRTGEIPEIVRMVNGAVSLVLINVGAGKVLHEPRVAYISLSVPAETKNIIRGNALFRSFTIEEDSPRAFRFMDPFGVSWQIVATPS